MEAVEALEEMRRITLAPGHFKGFSESRANKMIGELGPNGALEEMRRQLSFAESFVKAVSSGCGKLSCVWCKGK